MYRNELNFVIYFVSTHRKNIQEMKNVRVITIDLFCYKSFFKNIFHIYTYLYLYAFIYYHSVFHIKHFIFAKKKIVYEAVVPPYLFVLKI